MKETSGHGLSLGIGYDSQIETKKDLKTSKVSFFGYNYTRTEKTTTETSHSYQPGVGAGFFLNVQFGLDFGIKFKGK